MLYTDCGMFCFKLSALSASVFPSFTDQRGRYSQPHNYDTSLAWALLFRMLVIQGLVPAVVRASHCPRQSDQPSPSQILQRNFPNPRVFSLLRRYLEEVDSSSLISYKDDFFEMETAVERSVASVFSRLRC